MNKLKILFLISSLLVGFTIIYYFFLRPEQSIIIETIKPNIICFNTIC